MTAALTIADVSVQFGGLRAVDGISLSLDPGERRVLLGPNGAGKTTLFNVVGGQQRPTSGRILLFGQDITDLLPNRRAHIGLARTFQITSLFPTFTVEENVLLASLSRSGARFGMLRPAEADRPVVRRTEEILADWRLVGDRNMLVGELSYGEQRKLEIAMALAHRPRVLLLDEPTAGLSTAETENVVALIKGLDRDVTVVVIEHDMDVAFGIADRFTIMHQGRKLIEGDAADIRGNPEIAAIYLGEGEDA